MFRFRFDKCPYNKTNNRKSAVWLRHQIQRLNLLAVKAAGLCNRVLSLCHTLQGRVKDSRWCQRPNRLPLGKIPVLAVMSTDIHHCYTLTHMYFLISYICIEYIYSFTQYEYMYLTWLYIGTVLVSLCMKYFTSRNIIGWSIYAHWLHMLVSV